MDSFKLTDLLACPRCRTNLAEKNRALNCPSCSVEYPYVGALPFLFAEPAYALGEWRSRYRHDQARSLALADELEQCLADDQLLPATRKRLTQLQSAHREQRDAMADLLKPLLTTRSTETSRETYLALRTRLPNDQGLNTYFPNVHRDWSWGDEENNAAIEIVVNALTDTSAAPKRILVLGAGAGRLTSDLACHFARAQIVGLDFNPMLMLLAAEMTTGQQRQFFEFPIAPVEAEDVAVERLLRADPKPAGNCHWVIGDALRPPFADGQFDLVVTPWLLDILDVGVPELAKRVNRLLAPGGTWLNFGSMSFRRPDPRECLTREELIQTVAAEGFAPTGSRDHDVPYLDSPASRHARRERVATLTWDKSGEVADPGQYRALPDWIVTGTQPVPATEALQQQAAATRIHAFIMSMIDGKRSLRDMAALMEAQKLMSADDATDAIRGMLIKMYDEANRYSGF